MLYNTEYRLWKNTHKYEYENVYTAVFDTSLLLLISEIDILKNARLPVLLVAVILILGLLIGG